jgi:hypothetical protein
LRDLPPGSRLPGPVLDFLQDMDRKLDAILGHLLRQSLWRDFPEEGLVTELSGAGLTLESAAPLPDGDRLDILLLLEEYPLRTVCLQATVLARGAGAPLPRPGIFSLAYDCAGEEDRETIIRFLFQQERRLLRRRKQAEEGGSGRPGRT